ncbi:MAG: ADP-ribosyl-(dinitrogen reductase) hydrolase [Rubrivivax sp.]|nr:ADP-ribosyl-(dinitrogen reductase) hydrolase [Rubrivivax sp.]
MLTISPKIREKIGSESHGSVVEREVRECFMNRCGRVCLDPREQHAADAPTQWFVAPTHVGRLLKVIYVEDDESIYLKSAYPATREIELMFDKHAT